MNLPYLIAGGSIVAFLLIGGVIWSTKRRQRNIKPSLNLTGGVTMSDKFIKERLSSDFVLASIEDGVVIVGKDNIIHLFNPAAARITGWAAEEAVGLDYHNVLSLVNDKGEPYDATLHPVSQSLNQGKPVRDSKSWISTRTKKNLPISLIVSPVSDFEGRPEDSVVAVFRDITREKAEEAQRSEFISTASHEMRTPLAAIEGYLALALNEKMAKVDNNARSYIQKASGATKHLSILFQDLLASSKAEDGRLSSHPQVVDIGGVLDQATEAGRFKAKEKGLDLNYVVSTDKEISGGKVVRPLYYAFVDPNRIREVLENVIDNAIKYTQTGSVTVQLTGDSSVVQMQVRDTGAGIPPEDIPHLFQKFYRVDNSLTRTIGGTGLGLFICRRIVELYNGRIWVESTLGRGSTFFINLPRLSAEQALEAQKQQSYLITPDINH